MQTPSPQYAVRGAAQSLKSWMVSLDMLKLEANPQASHRRTSSGTKLRPSNDSSSAVRRLRRRGPTLCGESYQNHHAPAAARPGRPAQTASAVRMPCHGPTLRLLAKGWRRRTQCAQSRRRRLVLRDDLERSARLRSRLSSATARGHQKSSQSDSWMACRSMSKRRGSAKTSCLSFRASRAR